MLTLPIQGKWYHMILSGEKKEEYREVKPYYITRFKNALREHFSPEKPFAEQWGDEMLLRNRGKKSFLVRFRNGYASDSPSFVAKVNLRIDYGKTEWGAEKDKVYFVLSIEGIEDATPSSVA